MPMRRMVMELGMGTDIRGEDYTKASVRAVENALRQNSLNVADAFGVSREDMHVEINLGVQKPDAVDTLAVQAVLPYGVPTVNVSLGGMDIEKDNSDGCTILANAALVVYLDLPDQKGSAG